MFKDLDKIKVKEQYEKLPLAFYQRDDVVQIARDLIGKFLFSQVDGVLTGGMIVETEAYCGRGDKACHAHKGLTPRNKVMFEEGGHAYVYLCYGIHHLFNIVTNVDGNADAVLIRAIEPTEGVDTILQRRNKSNLKRITAGPGMVSQALGILTEMSGISLMEELIWVSEARKNAKIEIETDVRIGVDYAQEDALLPWRFYDKNSAYVSVKKK